MSITTTCVPLNHFKRGLNGYITLLLWSSRTPYALSTVPRLRTYALDWKCIESSKKFSSRISNLGNGFGAQFLSPACRLGTAQPFFYNKAGGATYGPHRLHFLVRKNIFDANKSPLWPAEESSRPIARPCKKNHHSSISNATNRHASTASMPLFDKFSRKECKKYFFYGIFL